MPVRLKEIKMAGFKSFVDPTKVVLSSNLSSIVGPNGCGKSNVIDAIRLVLGESSASKLRGGQIADMIFNGSSTRKPVGQASVELVFDNADGTIGGEFANFSEISVRRIINRDGLSKYYLNNTPCRRKDVTDMFLGTGIGPRSYSIIEQGMVSKLIEAKPEDMRRHIEEAARISTCRERRRETEIRMGHTRENLERLNDLRDEVGRQIVKLEKQAEAAEKYQTWQKEQTLLKAQQIALEWKVQDELYQQCAQKLSSVELSHEKVKADWQHSSLEIEKQKQALELLTENRDEHQRTFYQISTQANTLEQELAHRKLRQGELEKDREQLNDNLKEINVGLQSDMEKERNVEGQLTEKSPELHQANARSTEASEAAQQAESRLTQWQQQYDQLLTNAAVPTRRADVLKTSLAHQEEKIRFNMDRQIQLVSENDKLDIPSLKEQKSAALQKVEAMQKGSQDIQSELERAKHVLSEERTRIQSLQENRDAAAKAHQVAAGRLASLEALQQAALGQDKQKDIETWLTRSELDNPQRLGERIQAEPQWQRAIETVLAQNLQAICLEQLPSSEGLPAGLIMVTANQPLSASALTGAHVLSDKLNNPEVAGSLLSGLYCTKTLSEALALQGALGSGQSIVTAEGFWVGRDWLKVPADAKSSEQGVLARQTAITELSAEVISLASQEKQLLEDCQQAKSSAQVAEDQLSTLNQQRHAHDQNFAGVKSEQATVVSKLEQQERRHEQIEQEAKVIRENIASAETATEAMRAELQQVVEQMSEFTQQRDRLESQKDAFTANYNETRQSAKAALSTAHEIELQWQSLTNECQALRKSIHRAQSQHESLIQRITHVEDSLSETIKPMAQLQSELQSFLDNKLKAESGLTQARTSLTDAQTQYEQTEAALKGAASELSDLDGRAQTLKLEQQSATVRRESFEQALEQDPKEVLGSIEEMATAEQWKERIEKLDTRMKRLEPINLAAIDEYATQAERKEYLDAQNADLVEALEVLETAIGKIDKETRERFKETYDQVNANFQKIFPRLFGGGSATLSLTDDDLLDSGVAVMAHPPGKRNSLLQQLSGGEKALVAVSLVFAIFQLNPAPFCLLDEVDAPLDDANVGRFTEMVREMSDCTQFIFITHNKVTMALADVLMGVTMREPGVSRVVSVNVEEAAELAQA